MSRNEGKRSLQDVLRARRDAPALVTPGEAARREAARRREVVDAAAAEALARWRDGHSLDARRQLPPEVLRELFRLDPDAYYASAHWAHRVRAQLTATPTCEVSRCGAAADVSVQHLTHATLAEEEPGRDLITLCGACRRRAEKLGRKLRRVPTRGEVVALDPRAPLYDPGEIAALRAKYGG